MSAVSSGWRGYCRPNERLYFALAMSADYRYLVLHLRCIH